MGSQRYGGFRLRILDSAIASSIGFDSEKEKGMAGLARIAKMHGGLVAKNSRQAVVYRWDDETNEAVVVEKADRKDYDLREKRLKTKT